MYYYNIVQTAHLANAQDDRAGFEIFDLRLGEGLGEFTQVGVSSQDSRLVGGRRAVGIVEF